VLPAEVPEITRSLSTRTYSPLLGETISNVCSLGGEDVGLVVVFCGFGMIVCPYTMLVVATDARRRVMIDPIVNRWHIHNTVMSDQTI
jgi:hypothetical protein